MCAMSNAHALHCTHTIQHYRAAFAFSVTVCSVVIFFSLWRCGPTPLLDHTYWAPQSLGLLCASDQPVAQTSIWQHTTLTRDRHAPRGIRTHNLSKRPPVDLRLRPRGRPLGLAIVINSNFNMLRNAWVIIIIFINCNWVVTRWQWLFYM